FNALDIPVNRSSMSRWLKEIASLLNPIVQSMRRLILGSRIVQSDATTFPVIKKGLGKTHKGYVWVYRGDADYPYVFYDYSDTEHSIYPERISKGYTGILQTDGTNKFNEIIANGATSENCWAHVHCYFEDARQRSCRCRISHGCNQKSLRHRETGGNTFRIRKI
ncbi:MAG: IS66 family transposase, partial [Candidatus Obscuribacterales bacterium]|nr:IS66 family transposase [Candidatus Obscuribacterales bacterium]